MTHNLPVQLTPFIGRQREMAGIEQLLAGNRLVTLTGPGGCGKTRLALQVANHIRGRFRNGVCLVELAPLRDPAFIPQLIARILAVPHKPDQPVLDSLLEHLQSKEVLLVLDNCEHLIAGCAQLAQQILSRTPAPRLLVTSREPLAITGEFIYPVSGLDLPPNGAASEGDTQELMLYDSIHLFVERARAIMPNFVITTTNASTIKQICQRLDGLPLALELTSAHIHILSLHEILHRLDDRFAFLVSRQRSEPEPRHRSLRAAIDWSYDLLSSQEQVMLRRLSVFSGGCSLAAAEAVCTGDEVERGQVLGLLTALVNKSLVVAQTLQGSEARYGLLETIRHYAQEKVLGSSEEFANNDRHLQFFLRLAEEADTHLRGEHQRLWLNRLDREYDNLRAALAWAVEGGRLEKTRVSAGLGITASLYQFWRIRNAVGEGLNWCKQLFAVVSEAVSPVVLANAFAYASLLAGLQGQNDEQLRFAEEAVHSGEEAGESGRHALAVALGAQGYAVRKAGDYANALNLGMREIHLHREAGDHYMLGVSLSLNSFAAMSTGAYKQARAMLEEAIPLLKEAGDPYRIAIALNYAGDLARCERDYQQARTDYEESISILRSIAAVGDLAAALQNLGHACLYLGDFERAKALFTESMALHQEQSNRAGMTECLLGFAALAVTAGLPGAGARLLSAAAAAGGRQITSEWAATRKEYENYFEQTRASLDEIAYKAEKAAGERMSLTQAVAYAKGVVKKAAAVQRTHRPPDSLTPREREVAALIAQAKTNAEIADLLFVNKRTVETHIANIRSKLGFTERAQIVRWAIENGLVSMQSSDPT